MPVKNARNLYNSVSVSQYRRNIKKKAVEYKGGKCIHCGYDKCVAALQFHHTDPDKKDFHISSSVARSWEKVKTEIDKCDLVCSNCHAELHHEITETLFIEKQTKLREFVPLTKAKPPIIVNCEVCGIEVRKFASNKAKHFFCTPECKKKFKVISKIAWPSYNDLVSMVEASGYSATGRVIGVSGNSVKRRLKKLRLNPT
jgi:hypothetical protein